MAALGVVTSTNTVNAQVGNGEFVYIEVSVTHSGQPVTGLTKQQVTFKALMVGPGGSDIEWNPNPHGYWENHPGYYLIEVIPVHNGTWVHGTWTVAIEVNAGTNHGRSLASFSISP
jgi:hypothetical protein